MRAVGTDISIFDVGSESLLASARNVSFRIETETVDGRPITRRGKSAQPTKKQAIIETTAMSTVSSPGRVTHLHVSALTVDGENLRAHVRRGTVQVHMEHDEASGVGDLWRWPQVTGFDFRARLELLVPTTGVPLLAAAEDDGIVDLTMTINGVNVALPMVLTQWAQVMEQGKVQVVRADLVGRSPDTGTYPVAPVGTTTLLEKAVNLPDTDLAVALTSRAVNGTEMTGTFAWQRCGFGFADGQLVETQFVLVSRGALAVGLAAVGT